MPEEYVASNQLQNTFSSLFKYYSTWLLLIKFPRTSGPHILASYLSACAANSIRENWISETQAHARADSELGAFSHAKVAESRNFDGTQLNSLNRHDSMRDRALQKCFHSCSSFEEAGHKITSLQKPAKKQQAALALHLARPGQDAKVAATQRPRECVKHKVKL